MATQIRNNNEFLKVMKPVFKKVVEYVLDKIMETNQKIIWEVVYNADSPSVYERTGEFAEAWSTQVHTASHLKHDVEGSMFYNPSEMSVGSDDMESADYGQHIGVAPPYQGVDSRQYLADIIYQGLAGPAFGNGYWRKQRDAFSQVVEQVGPDNFNKWFIEGCRANGININPVQVVEPENK